MFCRRRVCRDTRWIGSWFQRQNNPNRKGSLAHQAMCEAKAAHAQGRGPPPKQPAHRSSSMPSHPGSHTFVHNTFPSFSSNESDIGLHMGAAEYHDRLRQAELERQRREALLQPDGERMPRTLIGPGIHPSMFLERRSSSNSLSHGGAGSRPCKDDTHPSHSAQIISRNFAPSDHARYPGVDASNSPPSPTDSQSADSPNPDMFSASQRGMCSGFAMPFSDSSGFSAGHGPGAFNVDDPHHQALGNAYPHSFVNFTPEAYQHQYHHPFHHPHFTDTHGNLGSAFQLGRPTLSRSTSHHDDTLGMHLHYPVGSEHDGHTHGFDGLAAFSNALLNPSPFLSAPRTSLDASAHGSDSAHAHGLSGHDCGPSTELELSLPQDIAAPRPVPYATYLHATSLQEHPSQSQSQAQPQTLHDHGHEEQHGLAHDPLASNSAVQWDGQLTGFAQEHGQRDGHHHQFYARAGESPGDVQVQMDEESVAATAVALQARFEALAAQAAAGGVNMGIPLSMEEFYHHGELRRIMFWVAVMLMGILMMDLFVL